MKLLSVIVAYHPDKEILKQNINHFLDYVDTLIIWDNSPDADSNILNEWKKHAKVKYMTSGKNEYIAFALNQAMKYGLENGFSHLLTMDQDSCFVGNTFLNYRNAIEDAEQSRTEQSRAEQSRAEQSRAEQSRAEHSLLLSKIPAIWSPAILDKASGTVKIPDNRKIITSGMIIDLKAAKQIGFFSEKYQIDYVDFEYVLRAIQVGYSTCIAPACQLQQRYGSPVKQKLGTAMNYSPIRLYFQTRNRMWLKRDYPQTAAVADWFSVNPKLIIKILLYETKKIAKIWAILQGTIDGLIR